jgi:hypothetical protein
LFKKASTGLVKISAHVMPHKISVEAALIQKYTIGVIICSLLPMYG